MQALAATAGVAIENARLYEEARHLQGWLAASTEVTRMLLSAGGEDPLRVIARQARLIADADIATVVLPTADGQQLTVEVASGAGAAGLLAGTMPMANSLTGRAITSGLPVLVGDADDATLPRAHVAEVGPVMVLPLNGSMRIRGALVIGRPRGRNRFSQSDLEMATTFANHAAVALELADARLDQQRIDQLEDRDRIARDLHDHVIQRLFAAGLTVQSVVTGLDDAGRADRLTRVVADIDETMRQIRTSIFKLKGPLGPDTGSVRKQLLEVAAEVAPMLGFEPELRFDGPIDSLVTEAIARDLVAVLRETLTNTARHAGATAATVSVSAQVVQLSMTVSDNGCGLAESARRSGLANLRERAERHGGTLTLLTGIEPHDPTLGEGTGIRWTIPLKV